MNKPNAKKMIRKSERQWSDNNERRRGPRKLWRPRRVGTECKQLKHPRTRIQPYRFAVWNIVYNLLSDSSD